MSYPSKKFEHSFVKLLQLCFNTLYVSCVNLGLISLKNSMNKSSVISVVPSLMVFVGLPIVKGYYLVNSYRKVSIQEGHN